MRLLPRSEGGVLYFLPPSRCALDSIAPVENFSFLGIFRPPSGITLVMRASMGMTIVGMIICSMFLIAVWRAKIQNRIGK